MRVNIQADVLRISRSGFSLKGGTLTSSLILISVPTHQSEAVTKQYIDNGLTSISASSITSGTLSHSRFPEFTGDIVKSAGSNQITLTNTGVTSGTYSKLVVDAKGRIISGSSLSSSDIPSLSWNKITTGKPTTLAGYGITDGLNKSGDTVTGHINITNLPTESLHAANKQYVDNKVNDNIAIKTGDIITRTSLNTPYGFLHCNGGEVSKTTYSSLYSVIGNMFSYVSVKLGSGQPWRQQYYFNNTQSGDIIGWIEAPSLPTNLTWFQVIVTKNTVYLIGGGSSWNNVFNTVYKAPINSDGTLGAWETDNPFPTPLSHSSVIVTKNRVYLLGGYNGNTALNTVYTATINNDGTLSAWTTSDPLPSTLYGSQAIVTKNRVYLLGGFSGGGGSTVYTAPINSDGTLGTWTTSTPLPVVLAHSSAIVTKDRVYLLSGMSGGNNLNKAFTASINSDGTLGSWDIINNLPFALRYPQTVVTKNNVYLLGGYTGSSGINVVYRAPINSDGTLGAWTISSTLPGFIYGVQAIITNSNIYLLCSYKSGFNSNVIKAPFSGGLNDYFGYYSGSASASSPDSFNLPDFTSRETTSMYYFIKT